jgi:hypothetical protein
VQSALERLRAGGIMTSAAYMASRMRLRQLLSSWREIQPTEPVRELACVKLERFRVRASDALQLSAALVWCKQKPKGRLFVCNDERLSAAAVQSGFDTFEV